MKNKETTHGITSQLSVTDKTQTMNRLAAVTTTISHYRQTDSFLHCEPKIETHVILNILYSCKSTAVKFSMWYPDGLSY